MCNCADQVIEQIKKDVPFAGMLSIQDVSFLTRDLFSGKMAAEAEIKATKQNLKLKKFKALIAFNNCPFCGKKYDSEPEVKETESEQE